MPDYDGGLVGKIGRKTVLSAFTGGREDVSGAEDEERERCDLDSGEF